MNGRQARGCGMSAHDRTKTTTKKAANSIVGKLTAGILSVASAVSLAAAPAAAAQSVLVIGDSLQTGTGPYLERELGSLPVEFDFRNGRGSAEGLERLRLRLQPEHTIVVFDLGTNDDPRNPDALYSTLGAARGIAGARCMVVATILSPEYGGVGPQGLSAAVERFAAGDGNAELADWYGAATGTPGVLYGDGYHAWPEGYALRARLFGDAIAACTAGGGTGDALSGIPAPSGDPAKTPRPRPPLEVPGPGLRVPAPLAALADAARTAAQLVSAAGRDARLAAGMA